MSNSDKSYTEKFKDDHEKLKNRAKELFKDISPDEEPQSVGDPNKAIEGNEERPNDEK